MGVRRAMRLALKAAETSPNPVYTYGPLIHNPQALELLEKLGIRDLKKSPPPSKGQVIIRAHGIPPQEKKALQESGLEVIDGTCPRVAKVQALARQYSQRGYQVILIGDRDHAEVRGILGYTNGKGWVVSSLKDLEELPKLERYVILSQTTQDEEVFEFLSQEILSRYPGGEVINTICHATHVRQESVRELAQECDTIVVIGGRGSANTNRLAQIAQEEGRRVFLVETPEELPLKDLSQSQKIGLSAGASTPNWLINGVVERLAELGNPFRKGWWLLVNSHLLLSGGLASLYGGLALWLKGDLQWSLMLSALALAFFAHTWNSLVAQVPLSLCNPYKARLYQKYQNLFLGASLLAFVIALIGAYRAGPPYLLLTALAGGLAAPYSLTFLRTLWPGNRTLFITLFWAVIALFYALPWPFSPKILGYWAFLSLLLAFFRALAIDLLDLMEDGFLGRESLAAFWGEKRALQFLGVVALAGVLWTAGGGLWNPKILILEGVWLYALGLWLLLRRKPLGRRLELESLSEGLPYIFLGLSLLLR